MVMRILQTIEVIGACLFATFVGALIAMGACKSLPGEVNVDVDIKNQTRPPADAGE
jgi:hypothetical protein